MEVRSPVLGDERKVVSTLKTVAEGGLVDDTSSGAEEDAIGLDVSMRFLYENLALTKNRKIKIGRLSFQWKIPMRTEKMVAKSKRPMACWYCPVGQSFMSLPCLLICCETRPRRAISMASHRMKKTT